MCRLNPRALGGERVRERERESWRAGKNQEDGGGRRRISGVDGSLSCPRVSLYLAKGRHSGGIPLEVYLSQGEENKAKKRLGKGAMEDFSQRLRLSSIFGIRSFVSYGVPGISFLLLPRRAPM